MARQAGLSVVIGGGPAGLTAAWELTRLGVPAVVFEKDGIVGGISRTVCYDGYRFDIGGHRFFTKVPLVEALWHEILGEDLLSRPRLSRIYYRGHFFDYPLRPLNTLAGLGPVEAVRILLSYARIRLAPLPEERNFEQWVTNRFGRRLYELFFRSYTEKVWGMPCTEIDARWAMQRIKRLDLVAALRHALLGQATRKQEVLTTLIDRFYYPRLGPGMMWERLSSMLADAGVETALETRVARLIHDGRRILGAEVEERDGGRRQVAGESFISSMPLSELVRCLDPPAPPEVLAAAGRLRYRDFLTVGLIVDQPEVFPDNWIYIHSPEVAMGRVQNFKNWSPDMVPDPAMSCLGLEYFVHRGDRLWAMPDEELLELGRRECAQLGLVAADRVVDGTVIRMPRAYPIYDAGYGEAVEALRDHLGRFTNLEVVGRNGQHRYNNQDHSMLAGIYAARNVAGAGDYDVWDVNVDPDYHEEKRAAGKRVPGERLVPQPAAPETLEALLRAGFARYDPMALGGAVAVVASVVLALATAVLLLAGGEPTGPTLSLLGNYLLDYTVSWRGLVIGTLEAGFGGFLFGYLLAKSINLLVGSYELACRRRLEMMRSLSLLEEPDS